MSTDFRPGDRARLTGKHWPKSNFFGPEVTIAEVTPPTAERSQSVRFEEDREGNLWYIIPGWEVEKIPGEVHMFNSQGGSRNPNPILVDFRRSLGIQEGWIVADHARWWVRLRDIEPDMTKGAWSDPPIAFTEEHYAHAWKVLQRLANLS